MAELHTGTLLKCCQESGNDFFNCYKNDLNNITEESANINTWKEVTIKKKKAKEDDLPLAGQYNVCGE